MKRLIIGGIFLVMGFYVIYNVIMPILPGSQEDVLNESRCKSEKRAVEGHVAGVLTRKFLDKSSHMWKTIEYSIGNHVNQSLILLNDQSGAYDFILPGDSIIKELNSLELKVTRNGNTKVFMLDFGCNATK